MTDQPTLRDMLDAPEPSNAEQSEWPDATRDYMQSLRDQNTDLQRRLDNICLNIHTCSGDDCERPVCVLRRELTTLRADRDALIEECAKCEKAGYDCGEHVPTWEEIAETQAAEIVALREALRPFAEVKDWADRNGHDLAHFDMLLRYVEGPKSGQFAGHLQVQSDEFIAAQAALGGQHD